MSDSDTSTTVKCQYCKQSFNIDENDKPQTLQCECYIKSLKNVRRATKVIQAAFDSGQEFMPILKEILKQVFLRGVQIKHTNKTTTIRCNDIELEDKNE